MKDLDQRLKDLIMDTIAQVLRDTGLDRTPFEDLTLEEVDILCQPMGFEIKARLTKFFEGLQPDNLKEHFKVVDESVEDVKQRFERERKVPEDEER